MVNHYPEEFRVKQGMNARRKEYGDYNFSVRRSAVFVFLKVLRKNILLSSPEYLGQIAGRYPKSLRQFLDPYTFWKLEVTQLQRYLCNLFLSSS